MDWVTKKMKDGARVKGVEVFRWGEKDGVRGLLYEDELVLGGESEEDLWVVMGGFAEIFRRGLKMNAEEAIFNLHSFLIRLKNGIQTNVTLPNVI